MDWYPLLNSLRIAAISTVVVFFLGIAAAHWTARLPRAVKGALDVVLTLPLVLPPTVVGWLLLLLLGPKRPLGAWVQSVFGLRLVMTWQSAISTTVYQLWRTGDDAGALGWVLVNIALSAVFLLAITLLETRQRAGR